MQMYIFIFYLVRIILIGMLFRLNSRLFLVSLFSLYYESIFQSSISLFGLALQQQDLQLFSLQSSFDRYYRFYF